MIQIRLNLNRKVNAKVERLRQLWGLKSKEKAILIAITHCPEFELLEERFKKLKGGKKW